MNRKRKRSYRRETAARKFRSPRRQAWEMVGRLVEYTSWHKRTGKITGRAWFLANGEEIVHAPLRWEARLENVRAVARTFFN